MKNFFVKNVKVIAIISLVVNGLLFFRGCSASNENKKLSKEVQIKDLEIDSLVKTIPSRKIVKDQMEEVMLDYLIYEDELDKKEITISNIKDKITSND